MLSFLRLWPLGNLMNEQMMLFMRKDFVDILCSHLISSHSPLKTKPVGIKLNHYILQVFGPPS